MALSSPSLVVKVAPRRLRIAALTVLAIGAIVAGTILFHRGVELQRIDARTTSTSSQTQLLEDYNAYSGFVAAAFGSPLEIFVAMAVQVVVLRLFATQLTRAEPAWHVGIVALTAAAGVGYLIGNSFNALNVQLKPLDVGLTIAASDLMSTIESPRASSIANRSVAEMTTPGNPVVNTMLRNLVLQQVPRAPTLCADSNTANQKGDVHDHFLTSDGLQQRDWFSRVLAQAPSSPSSNPSMRLAVGTNSNSNANANANELPMNATLAADLVLYAMVHGHWYFPFANASTLLNDRDILERYPELGSRKLGGSMAELTGLLPTSKDATPVSETTQRETLVRESVAMATRQFAATDKIKSSGVSMTFSHHDISPSVRFDAVTLEFEMDPTLLANAASQDRATPFTNLDQYYHCGPWPGLCLVNKVAFPGDMSSSLDVPAQVKALSPCVDAQGTERMTMELSNTGNQKLVATPKCPQTSNTSMLILSFAKRLSADAITESTVRNASGSFPQPWSTVNKTASVTNLRKMYTFTVGRLSWNLEDLAAANHAQCIADDGNCLGLQLALSPLATNASALKQQLVVGATALPLERFFPMGSDFSQRPKFVDIVEVFEPVGTEKEPALAGDPLLLHNIGSVTWNSTLATPTDEPVRCYARVEDRLRLIVNNHYYSEHSLQPAYTAATWFLFQNGVVKQTVALPDGRETLDFAANVQRVAVWISTPQTSAWLTLAGCFILAVGLLVSVGKSYCQGTHQPLSTITDPHVIARVLVDDEQFPPRLLKRRVVEENGVRTDVEERVVASLSLRPVDEQENPGKRP